MEINTKSRLKTYGGKHYFWKKLAAVTVSGIIILSLAACGRDKDAPWDGGSGSTQSLAGYVYVPEYVELENAEGAVISDAKIMGGSLYYTKVESATSDSARTNPTVAESITADFAADSDSTADTEDGMKRFLCEYSLAEHKVVRKMLLSEEGGFTYDFRAADDGSVYVLDYPSSCDSVQLLAFDAQGNLQRQMDLMKEMNERFAHYLTIDDQNRLYLAMDSGIALIDAEGTLYGTIPLKSNIRGIGTGKEGTVYACYPGDTSTYGSESVLAEVDFEGKKLGDVYENYPNSFHANLVPGTDYDFLVNDGYNLYGYNLASQSSEKIFSWIDCGVDINPMSAFCPTEDGKIMLLTRSGGAGTAEMTVLEKKDASNLPQKTELVLGTLYAGDELKAAVVAFNRQSDSCHVTIKNYITEEKDSDDALQDINIDIISANNCPDLFELHGLNVEALAANGVFENLNTWLEQSSELDREDYLENILDNYTYDGILTAVPAAVTLYTLAGRTEVVGKKPGWTVEDMIRTAKANPDARLCSLDCNQAVLQDCLLFGSYRFIDWTTGTADFECDEFKEILAFANQYPSWDAWKDDGENDVAKMRQGKQLLSEVFISAFQDIQLYDAMYNGAAYIGFPTADGSNGCVLDTFNAYAISSKCGNKEAAWSFIEYFLKEGTDERFAKGFPSDKNELAAKATAVEYIRDQNGDFILDSNGKLCLRYDTVNYNGVEYKYHAVTDEEIELAEYLLDTAQVISSLDMAVSRIIYQEAEYYFQGQKSIDDVAAVIQNRVQLYLDENW